MSESLHTLQVTRWERVVALIHFNEWIKWSFYHSHTSWQVYFPQYTQCSRQVSETGGFYTISGPSSASLSSTIYPMFPTKLRVGRTTFHNIPDVPNKAWSWQDYLPQYTQCSQQSLDLAGLPSTIYPIFPTKLGVGRITFHKIPYVPDKAWSRQDYLPQYTRCSRQSSETGGYSTITGPPLGHHGRKKKKKKNDTVCRASRLPRVLWSSSKYRLAWSAYSQRYVSMYVCVRECVRACVRSYVCKL